MNRMVFALALCGAAIRAEGVQGNVSQEVIVYVDDQASVPLRLMERAKAVASEIFAGIDVRIRWKAGRPHRANKIGAGGCARQNDRPIVITTALNTPKGLKPDTRAFADLGSGSITVFCDRIQETLRNWPKLAPVLLAHVLVHEVTHVLQGVAQHSATGVMKARWTMDDYHEMEQEPLPFTPVDISLIRLGLAARSAGSCADDRAKNPSVERTVR